jgi:hypothetical protein
MPGSHKKGFFMLNIYPGWSDQLVKAIRLEGNNEMQVQTYYFTLVATTLYHNLPEMPQFLVSLGIWTKAPVKERGIETRIILPVNWAAYSHL